MQDTDESVDSTSQVLISIMMSITENSSTDRLEARHQREDKDVNWYSTDHGSHTPLQDEG